MSWIVYFRICFTDFMYGETWYCWCDELFVLQKGGNFTEWVVWGQTHKVLYVNDGHSYEVNDNEYEFMQIMITVTATSRHGPKQVISSYSDTWLKCSHARASFSSGFKQNADAKLSVYGKLLHQGSSFQKHELKSSAKFRKLWLNDTKVCACVGLFQAFSSVFFWSLVYSGEQLMLFWLQEVL